MYFFTGVAVDHKKAHARVSSQTIDTISIHVHTYMTKGTITSIQEEAYYSAQSTKIVLFDVCDFPEKVRYIYM